MNYKTCVNNAVLSAQQVQDKEGAGVRACEKGDAFPGEAPLSEDHYPATATRGRIETFHQEDTGSPGASFCQAFRCHCQFH